MVRITLQGTITYSPQNGILKMMIFPTSQGGICIHSLEGNPKKLVIILGWKAAMGDFCPKDRRTGHRCLHAHVPYWKRSESLTTKNELREQIPTWQSTKSNFQQEMHLQLLGVLPRSFSGDQCIYLRLLCYPACWFLIHVTWVFGVPTYKGTSLGNASVWCTRFSRELSWIPKVNFRDFKVALPLSLHFREMFSGFTWMLVAEFVSKSIKVEGSISKEFG